MRAQMPNTAAMVDELRAVLGTEKVDAAIRAGQRARREHAAMVASAGQRQADAWLARQKFPAGLFWASEGGHEVGLRRSA
jgi:RNA polymerase-interacting CarD/CdnL/TRCF family regulator